VQPRRGPAEMQFLGDGDEIAQLAQFQIHRINFLKPGSEPGFEQLPKIGL
jgi:hypothetical protein